jgi:hypothetical protein
MRPQTRWEAFVERITNRIAVDDYSWRNTVAVRIRNALT